MKQLLILSGKGGTGKTTVAGAFIKLAEAKAYADCDVDAPNLHLLAGRTTPPVRSDYYGLPVAAIDQERCIECDRCRTRCRFDAISLKDGYTVDPFACEGCGVCSYVCPADAIRMEPAKAGELELYTSSDSVFSTAQLKMGSGNSGKLVSEVKKQMRAHAQTDSLAIIDGSPGIGCPVIASVSGVNLVLIVAEPSLSGISDLERIVQTARKLGANIAVCINKYDNHPDHSAQIERYCRKQRLPFTGKIPFDPAAVQAVNRGESVIDTDSPAADAIREVFQNTVSCVFGNTN